MKRVFFPGEEWLYLKIYCGVKESDTILAMYVSPYAERLFLNGSIKAWFFVRFTDPDYHLRIRFLCCDVSTALKVYSDFFTFFLPLIPIFNIWKIQQDTYLREVERYGADTIDFVEYYFQLDSYLATKLLLLEEKEGDEQQRWKRALILIDIHLSIFRYSLEERLILMQEMSENFLKEFGNDKTLISYINDTYRANKLELIDLVLNHVNLDITSFFSSNLILDKIKKNLNTVLGDKDALSSFRQRGISSILHMSLNRLFRSRQRQHEAVIYSLISKTYKSIIASGSRP